MENGLLYGIIAVLVIASYKFLGKGTSQPITNTTEGIYVLTMNKFFKVFGWIMVIIGIAALLSIPVFAIEEENTLTMVVVIGLMGLTFGFLGLFLIKIFKTHSLTFDENTITVKNYFGKEIKGEWGEIEKIKFNGFTNLVVITLSNSQKLKCSQFLVGLISFLELAETKTTKDLSKIKKQVAAFE